MGLVNEIAPLVWCRLLDPRQVRFVHLSKTDPGRWPTAKALTQRLDRTAGYSWSSTPAHVHEAVHTSAIHEALSEAELAPSEHLIDAAYLSAEHLGAADARHRIDLIGPTRSNHSRQRRTAEASQVADFIIH